MAALSVRLAHGPDLKMERPVADIRHHGAWRGARAVLGRKLRQWWWFPHVRRVQHEGLVRAWRRRRSWNQVLRSPAVRTGHPDGTSPFELHLLCCLADYVAAIWALKSLLKRSAPGCPVYLHLQGHSTARMRSTLGRHFPDAVVITQSEADAVVIPALRARNLQRVLALRAALPVALKLVDVPFFGGAPRLLVMDSDVLFFRRPDELLEAALTEGPAVFQRDVESCYVMSPDAARELGVELQPRLNSGLMAIDRASIDLDRCERYLGHEAFRTPSGWAEQTLFALLASAAAPVSLLPPTYAISMTAEPEPDGLAARHYSGTSRSYLTTQGIPWLAREGCVLNGARMTALEHAAG